MSYVTLEEQICDPDRYEGAVPCTSNIPTTAQIVKGKGLFKVVAGVGADPINGTGALVANFRNGYNAIEIFYPRKSVATNGVLSIAVGPRFFRGGVLDVDPNLSTMMSMGRLGAALVCMQANTQSTTSASLSGEISMSAIADFRDLDKWTQTELRILAMSEKSGFFGQNISEPSFAILGPDPIDKIKAIDPSLAAESGENLVTKYAFGAANAHGVVFGPQVTLPGVVSVEGPVLPPRSRVSVQASVGRGGPTGFSNVIINAEWVRVNADPNAACDFQSRPFPVGATIDSLNSITTPMVDVFDPALSEGGYELLGVRVTSNVGDVIHGITIKVDDFYGNRYFAGWRIGLWEDVGVGQNISVTYTGAVDGLPTGQLAFFKRPDDTKSVGLSEWQDFKRLFGLNLMARCVHGSSRFRVSHIPTASTQRALQMGLFDGIGRVLGKGLETIGSGIDGALGMRGMAPISMAGMVNPLNGAVRRVREDE